MAVSNQASIDPIIHNPIADAIGAIQHYQYHSVCRDFELRLVKCIEAHGYLLGRTECIGFTNDLFECIYSGKQVYRSDIIQGEYTRQVKNGERDYQKPPFLGLY